jgi:hypothetical protein
MRRVYRRASLSFVRAKCHDAQCPEKRIIGNLPVLTGLGDETYRKSRASQVLQRGVMAKPGKGGNLTMSKVLIHSLRTAQRSPPDSDTR